MHKRPITPTAAVYDHLVSGWKEIANDLGMGVRTVQRYQDLRRIRGRGHGLLRGNKTISKE